MKRTVVYIDGFNLYHGIKAGCSVDNRWLDVMKLSKRFKRDEEQIIGLSYFTANIIPKPNNNAHKRQETYLKALANLGCDIHYGYFQSITKKCRNCGNSYTAYEEKQTDVNIATKMLEDAAASRMDVAYLISGDSDLIPPIDAIQRLYPKIEIVCAFPPKRRSIELANKVKRSFVISKTKVRQSRLPEAITLQDGSILNCPGKWKKTPSTS